MRKLDLTNPYQARGKEMLDDVMGALKNERINQGLTQKQVAERAKISVSTVSKYERGLYPTRLVWFAAIYAVLGCKLAVVWNDPYGDFVTGVSDVDRLLDSLSK